METYIRFGQLIRDYNAGSGLFERHQSWAGGDDLHTPRCDDFGAHQMTWEAGKHGCAAVIGGQRAWREADSEPRPIYGEPPVVRRKARE